MATELQVEAPNDEIYDEFNMPLSHASLLEEGLYGQEDIQDALKVGREIITLSDIADEIYSGGLGPAANISDLGRRVYSVGIPRLSRNVELGERVVQPLYERGFDNTSLVTRLETKRHIRAAANQAVNMKRMKRRVPGPESNKRAVDNDDEMQPQIYTQLTLPENVPTTTIGRSIPAYGPSLSANNFTIGGSIPYSVVTPNGIIGDGRSDVVFVDSPEGPKPAIKARMLTRGEKFRFGSHFNLKVTKSNSRNISDLEAYKNSVQKAMFQEVNGKPRVINRPVILEYASRQFNDSGVPYVYGRGTMEITHTLVTNGIPSTFTDRVVFSYQSANSVTDVTNFLIAGGIVITFVVTLIPKSSVEARVEAVRGHQPLHEDISFHSQFRILSDDTDEQSEEIKELVRDMNVQAMLHDPYLLLPYHLLYDTFNSITGFSNATSMMEGKYDFVMADGEYRLINLNTMHYGVIEIEDVMEMPEDMVDQLYTLFLDYISKNMGDKYSMNLSSVDGLLSALFSSSSFVQLSGGKIGVMTTSAVADLSLCSADISFTKKQHCVRILLNRFYKTHINNIYSRMITQSDLQACHIPLSVFQNGISMPNMNINGKEVAQTLPTGFAVSFVTPPAMELLRKFRNVDSPSNVNHSRAGQYIGMVHGSMNAATPTSQFTVEVSGLNTVGFDDLGRGMVNLVREYLSVNSNNLPNNHYAFIMYHPEFAFILISKRGSHQWKEGGRTNHTLYFIDHPRASSIVPSMNNLPKLLRNNVHIGTTSYLGQRGYGLLQPKFAACNYGR